jgi:hypothetical protein
MKLQHLLLIPWDIQAPIDLDFFNTRVPPRFFATMEGHGFLSQKDPLSESYFVHKKVVSHGYKISQCNDHELMMLFHFLIPIFHPRKPTYILVKWANTIIALWTGERKINWAFIMHKVIRRGQSIEG